MKHTFLILAVLLFIIACSDNDSFTDNDPDLERDYRTAFIGTYDCEFNKGGQIPGPDVELEIRIDSSTNDRIIVGNDTVPISVDGTFGPDLLRPGFHYELKITEDSVYLYSHVIIPNGIVMPCVFECVRQ